MLCGLFPCFEEENKTEAALGCGRRFIFTIVSAHSEIQFEHKTVGETFIKQNQNKQRRQELVLANTSHLVTFFYTSVFLAVAII